MSQRAARAAVTALLLAAPLPAQAEFAAVVGADQAQAFLVGHRGQCYAIVPDHVTQRSTFSLVGGSPERQGNAAMTPLRFPDMDLALATVSGPLARECEPQFSDLQPSLAAILRRQAQGEVVRIRGGGALERVPVAIASVAYETVTVDVADSTGARLGKGTSGSVLMIGGEPAGIAIETDDGESGIFLRMDAIRSRLSRFIEGREVFAVAASGEAAATVEEDDGLPFKITDWNVTPLEAGLSPANLEMPGTGPFVAPPLDQAIRLELTLDGEAPQAVSTVRLVADIGDESVSAPKSVAVDVDSTVDGQSPRDFARGEMGLDGVFEAKRPATFARRVIVRIHSAWFPDRPVRIDRIIIR